MWQAQDPIGAGILGLGTGSGWPRCSYGTGLLASWSPPAPNLFPGTSKVCEGWSVSPLRPLPLLQLGVGFWCRLDACVFSGTALNENILRGGLCWQGVDWAPWQGGSFLRALSGRVGATVGALWSLQFTLRGDTENLGWWVEVTTAFSWK